MFLIYKLKDLNYDFGNQLNQAHVQYSKTLNEDRIQ